MTARGIIIGDGDSKMRGYGVTTPFFTTIQASLGYGAAMTYVNMGVDGRRMEDINTGNDGTAAASSRIDPLLAANDGPTKIVILLESVNSLVQGKTSADHLYNRWSRYGAERRRAGARVIIIGADVAFAITANSLETQRQSANTLLGTNHNTFADAIVDLRGDTVFDDTASCATPPSTYYLADGLHWTQAGHDRMAGLLVPVIQSLI